MNREEFSLHSVLETSVGAFTMERAMRLFAFVALGFGVIACGLPQGASAEDLNAIFKKVNEYVEQKNFPKALEELNWAEKEITKMNSRQIESFFPDQIEGFQGGKTEMNAVMGMTNVSRTYTSGSRSIELSLVGGGAGGGLGGLAGLGRMAAMMGQGAGQDSFRVQGQTASLDTEEGQAELSVFLDSGSILKLDGSNLGSDGGATLKKFIEALKVSDLDKYLKGMS